MRVVYMVIGSFDYEGEAVISAHASEEQANSAAELELQKGSFDQVIVRGFEVNNDDA